MRSSIPMLLAVCLSLSGCGWFSKAISDGVKEGNKDLKEEFSGLESTVERSIDQQDAIYRKESTIRAKQGEYLRSINDNIIASEASVDKKISEIKPSKTHGDPRIPGTAHFTGGDDDPMGGRDPVDPMGSGATGAPVPDPMVTNRGSGHGSTPLSQKEMLIAKIRSGQYGDLNNLTQPGEVVALDLALTEIRTELSASTYNMLKDVVDRKMEAFQVRAGNEVLVAKRETAAIQHDITKLEQEEILEQQIMDAVISLQADYNRLRSDYDQRLTTLQSTQETQLQLQRDHYTLDQKKWPLVMDALDRGDSRLDKVVELCDQFPQFKKDLFAKIRQSRNGLATKQQINLLNEELKKIAEEEARTRRRVDSFTQSQSLARKVCRAIDNAATNLINAADRSTRRLSETDVRRFFEEAIKKYNLHKVDGKIDAVHVDLKDTRSHLIKLRDKMESFKVGPLRVHTWCGPDGQLHFSVAPADTYGN